MNLLGRQSLLHYIRYLTWPALIVAAFVGAAYAAVLVIRLLNLLNAGWSTDNAVGALGFRVLIYVIMLVLVVGIPFYVFKHAITLRDAGLSRIANWTDLGLALA